jgi:hypothetical protein
MELCGWLRHVRDGAYQLLGVLASWGPDSAMFKVLCVMSSGSVCVCVCQCLFSAFHTVISLLRSLYQSQHGKMYHFSSCDRFN